MSATRINGKPGEPGEFAVPSASHPGETWRLLWIDADRHRCDCPAHRFRGRCRHADAATAAVAAEDAADRERSARRCAEIAALFDCESPDAGRPPAFPE